MLGKSIRRKTTCNPRQRRKSYLRGLCNLYLSTIACNKLNPQSATMPETLCHIEITTVDSTTEIGLLLNDECILLSVATLWTLEEGHMQPILQHTVWHSMIQLLTWRSFVINRYFKHEMFDVWNQPVPNCTKVTVKFRDLQEGLSKTDNFERPKALLLHRQRRAAPMEKKLLCCITQYQLIKCKLYNPL